MLIVDREYLWPRLEAMGEKMVRELLAADQFEAHEEDEVHEWLHRKAAVATINDARITKWVAIVGAVSALVAAIASVWGLFK